MLVYLVSVWKVRKVRKVRKLAKLEKLEKLEKSCAGIMLYINKTEIAIWPRPVCYTQGMRPCADEVDFQVDLRLTWGRPEANVLNVLVNTWNWMRSTWGWLEVDLQVYFVGTRPARFSKNVIYDIGAKIILLKKCVFVLTGISRFWKRFL